MNLKVIIAIVIVIIIVLILYYKYFSNYTENMIKSDSGSIKQKIQLYKKKKFIITPPGEPYNRYIADSFRFKTWDGSNWTAQLINNVFYLKRMGSNRINHERVLNILRFRSQEWQAAFLPDQNKFLVFRLAGIRGMPFKVLDLVDWNNFSYTVEVIE